MPPRKPRPAVTIIPSTEPAAAGATANGETPPLIPGMPSQFKAFTTLRVPGGWAFLELTLDADCNVLNVQASQPDVKAHIQEKFKIQVGKYWQKIGG